MIPELGHWLVKKVILNFYILVILLILFTVLYFYTDATSKWEPILGGLISALLVVIIQFLFSWETLLERERISKLGLLKVLKTKRDRAHYGKLIGRANKRIFLMGHTARHFLEDFANNIGSHDETNALHEALRKPHMKVRFLLPDSKYLSKDALGDREEAESKLKDLTLKFPNFSYRYFNHSESHSIFVADDDVIIGPFFTGLPSMDSPALHVKAEAHFAKKYLAYFEAEWDRANPSE